MWIITSDLWFGLNFCFPGLIPHRAYIHIGIAKYKWASMGFPTGQPATLFHFESPYLCGPSPHSLRGQPYLSSPFPAKHHWHSKQTPVPRLGFGHLFCPSLENAIKPAWQLCQHKGQRGLHGRKLCKIHSSKGCVKNILTEKSFHSKWNIVSCASFSFPYFAFVMDLC